MPEPTQDGNAAREPLPEACACESCQDAAWPQAKGHDAAWTQGVPVMSAASPPEFGTSGTEKSERTEPGAAWGNSGSSCTCSAYWIDGKLVRTGNGPSKFRCVER